VARLELCYFIHSMRISQAEPLPPDPFALAGARLDGKYRVDRVVAEGGFGVVYAGHHTVLDVPIAIKVLKPTPGDAAEQSQRFSREAQTIAKLKHPSIVQVLDAGLWRPATDGSAVSVARDVELPLRSNSPLPWMVLEWLSGQTLKANLVERRGLGGRTPIEAMAVIRPVLDAVCYAHSKQVAHRDLKPSNIMLSPGSGGTLVRVLDFGVAKVIDEESTPDTGHTQTRGSSHAFSRSYAAPEQLAGGRTGPWTDIHALGLLLTELLTDRTPFATYDPTELFELVFHAERPSPARHGLDVGPWQAIIERAVSLKPSRRFADVTALATALEQTLNQATVAFAACQSRKDRVVDPEDVHSSAADASPSAATASNTFSVFSSEQNHNSRSRLASLGSRRSMSRLAALAAIAGAGSYFVFTGHRSAKGPSDPSYASETAMAPAADLQRAAPLASPVPAGSPTTPAVPDIEASIDKPAASAAPSQRASQKSRALRRAASTEVESPAAPAPAQLPPYVVE
jgi:eukaryotic-like serine/threonine-protein kinase